MHHSISLIVNGVRRDIALADACATLLDLLREQLHLEGMRRRPKRRLHHFRRWPADQFLPRFGGASRWRRDHANRRPSRSQFLGAIWGASFAPYEEAVVDQRSGRVMNADLAEYPVPVNADVPSMDVPTVEEHGSACERARHQGRR